MLNCIRIQTLLKLEKFGTNITAKKNRLGYRLTEDIYVYSVTERSDMRQTTPGLPRDTGEFIHDMTFFSIPNTDPEKACPLPIQYTTRLLGKCTYYYYFGRSHQSDVL